MLNEGNLSITLLRDAILVGVSHAYAGKKGRKTEPLTEKMVNGWIDDVEEVDGITFDELMEAVVRCIVGGMPGGQRYLEKMDDDADDEAASDVVDMPAPESVAKAIDDGVVRPPEPPAPTSDAEKRAALQAQRIMPRKQG